MIKLTAVIIMEYHCYQLQLFIQYPSLKVNSICIIITVGFDVTDQLLIRFLTFIRCWRKKWEYSETVYQLFIALIHAGFLLGLFFGPDDGGNMFL
jgi:hypothetical protein